MQLAPRYCNPGEEGFNGDGVLAPIFQSEEHGEIQTSGEPGVERAIFQSLTNGMRTAVRKGNSGLCCCSCCWLWFTRRGSRSSSPAGNVLLRLGVASHWSNGGVDPGSALQLHASAWGFSFSGLTLPAPARRDIRQRRSHADELNAPASGSEPEDRPAVPRRRSRSTLFPFMNDLEASPASSIGIKAKRSGRRRERISPSPKAVFVEFCQQKPGFGAPQITGTKSCSGVDFLS